MATVSFVRPGSPTTEILRLGPLTIRVLASGPHTSTILLTISPNTPAFPLHFHCMHQVNFFILRGTARFITSGTLTPVFSAKGGEFVEVPVGARYGFSNPFSKETEMLVTYAPGYYVECLREMAKSCEGGKVMTGDEQARIVRGWATVVDEGKGQVEGSAMEEDQDDDDEDEEEDDDENMGPRYTGLRCMA